MRVYLDHNSTTPLRREARERWLEVVDDAGANPSSIHASGRRARAWIDRSREQVARALGVEEDEIFFTSGATEANNLALKGVMRALDPRAALVTSAVEHSSILGPAVDLESGGHPVTRVAPTPEGRPDPRELARAVRASGARLVSVARANNETGAVADLEGLRGELKALEQRPLLHTDAVQVLGRLPVRLHEWGADLASFSAHKLGGPPGVGILWRRKGVPLLPLTSGGGQEVGLRPGTENAPGIAAAALAVELAVREQASYERRVSERTRALWDDLRRELPSLRLLGPPLDDPRRLPNTLCVLVPETDGQMLVTRLDLAGLEVSAGSACASGSIEPSHVLLAMGLGPDAARAGLRLSLGRDTTVEECKRTCAIFRGAFSPSRAT